MIVHAMLAGSSVALIILTATAVLRSAHGRSGWSIRRDLGLLALVTPVVGLAFPVVGLFPVIAQTCYLHLPPWDDLIGMAVPIAMGLIAISGLGLGLSRLGLLLVLELRGRHPMRAPNSDVQVLIDQLAEKLRVAPPRVVLQIDDRPRAFTVGLIRPTIVLSTWMVARLDQRELEAVLAHELSHIARRDVFVTWLALTLRDAFFYLPSSRAAYQRLREDQELACDDLAVGITYRPLALASALAKVWQDAITPSPHLAAALHLAAPDVGLEGRIRRLLDGTSPVTTSPGAHSSPLALIGGSLVTLVGLPGLDLLLLVMPMGCGPLVHMLGL